MELPDSNHDSDLVKVLMFPGHGGWIGGGGAGAQNCCWYIVYIQLCSVPVQLYPETLKAVSRRHAL